jgi:S-adenosylmethionine:tRNA ribosyltransferase-isomerase
VFTPIHRYADTPTPALCGCGSAALCNLWFLFSRMSAFFELGLPPELSAREPPERRGLARDKVRLLVIRRSNGEVIHSRFDRLSDFLVPGDVLVFNSSGTLPASLNGRAGPDDVKVEVRLAEHLHDGSWLALVLLQEGVRSGSGLPPGLTIDFSHDLEGRVEASDPANPQLCKAFLKAAGI